MAELEPQKLDEDENKVWWQPGLLLFFQLSGWLVGPILVAIFLGRWLDTRYGTEPWLYFICIGLAFVLSMLGIVREALRAMKEIEELSQKKK